MLQCFPICSGQIDIGGRCQWKYEVRRLADRGLTNRGETWIAWRARKINTYQNCIYRAEEFYSPAELLNCDDRVKVKLEVRTSSHGSEGPKKYTSK